MKKEKIKNCYHLSQKFIKTLFKCLQLLLLIRFYLNLYWCIEKHIAPCSCSFKGTRNSLKKWPLNLWWISNKTIMEVGNILKAVTFKSFLHLSYKNIFLWTVLFNIFMRQTLAGDFLGLHKNMNWAFSLRLIEWWKGVRQQNFC